MPLADYGRLEADITRRGFYPVQVTADELDRLNCRP